MGFGRATRSRRFRLRKWKEPRMSPVEQTPMRHSTQGGRQGGSTEIYSASPGNGSTYSKKSAGSHGPGDWSGQAAPEGRYLRFLLDASPGFWRNPGTQSGGFAARLRKGHRNRHRGVVLLRPVHRFVLQVDEAGFGACP